MKVSLPDTYRHNFIFYVYLINAVKYKKKKTSMSFIHGSDVCRTAVWFNYIPTRFRSLDGMSV